jgi:uncharacterized protein YukE
MPAFRVIPGSLDQYAGVLGDGGHDVNLASAFGTTAAGYVSSYSSVPYDSSDLFEEVYRANASVVARLERAMPEIELLLEQSAAALVASARDYRTTDEAQNARADGLWDGRLGPVPPLSDIPSSNGRVTDPTSRLSGVPSSDASIPDPVHWVMDKAGWISIAGTALKIASLFGLDPMASLTKAVTGNYGELAQAGHAAEALADFEHAAADAINTGLGAMLQDWTGNAADEAQLYFSQLATALEAHARELDDLGEKYAELVQACAQIATVLSSLLAIAIDKILMCVASLAAAGCLSTVPGINVLVSLIGAYQVWTTKDAVAAFIKACTGVTLVVESFLGLVLWIDQAFMDQDVASTFPPAPYANSSQS